MWCICIMSSKACNILSTSSVTIRNILSIFLFLLLFYYATAIDDSVSMLKLAMAIHPIPKRWSTTNSTDYCSWEGIECLDNRVIAIYLEKKELSGTLPSELSSLSQLQHLSLHHNNLTGPLPSLAKLVWLKELYIGNNGFTSIPPDFFQGLIRLQSFSISYNKKLASWSLPNYLTQCGALVYFDAKHANIKGNIPDFFASLPSLQSLTLSNNNLTGTLPASLANSGIQFLRLRQQFIGLSGNTAVLSSMTRLQKVILEENKFTGPIPDLSKCQNLTDVLLSDNMFTGIVPCWLVSDPNLKNVALSSNKLQGPTPKFSNNVSVDMNGSNNFCLTIPGASCDPQVTTLLEIAGALGYPVILSDYWKGNEPCKNWLLISCDRHNRIITVNFIKQNFTGTISPAFANLTALRNLFLNDNNLTGSIPKSLTKLTRLRVLDVSNNNLTGIIPLFASSVKLVTLPGNPLLEMNNLTRNGGNKLSSTIIVGVAISITIFIVLITSLIFLRFKIKKTVAKSVEGENVVISIEVLRQVTNNFSENNILGKGGFGTVYKGEFQDGSKIAVKRMEASLMGSKGMNGFKAEVSVLTKVRHRHLVALLGFCINGKQRYLVYEYMPQGTLAQRLFEWRDHGCPPLTWKQRVRIALDVAHGVEYLHMLAQQSFIHRDLKTSNILLGDDLTAKVGDFGLVRNVPAGKYSLQTRVAGTFGYLAPEYAATGRVTMKVDVYAFGVILMEMITGRKALDYTQEDKGWMFMHLATWFRGILTNRDEIQQAIDETLEPDEETFVSICKVAELAGQCTSTEPNQRPDMGIVVSILKPLVQDWEPAS